MTNQVEGKEAKRISIIDAIREGRNGKKDRFDLCEIKFLTVNEICLRIDLKDHRTELADEIRELIAEEVVKEFEILTDIGTKVDKLFEIIRRPSSWIGRKDTFCDVFL